MSRTNTTGRNTRRVLFAIVIAVVGAIVAYSQLAPTVVRSGRNEWAKETDDRSQAAYLQWAHVVSAVAAAPLLGTILLAFLRSWRSPAKYDWYTATKDRAWNLFLAVLLAAGLWLPVSMIHFGVRAPSWPFGDDDKGRALWWAFVGAVLTLLPLLYHLRTPLQFFVLYPRSASLMLTAGLGGGGMASGSLLKSLV